MRHIFIMSALTFLWSCFGRQPVYKSGLEGNSIPECTFLLEDSTTYISPASINNNKPLILFYFSPDCPYCRAQMRDIVRHQLELKDIDIFVLTTWPFKEMKEFSREFELSRYDNIKTGVDHKKFLLKYFNPPGVPLLAVYGPDKKLRRVFNRKTNISLINEIASQ